MMLLIAGSIFLHNHLDEIAKMEEKAISEKKSIFAISQLSFDMKIQAKKPSKPVLINYNGESY